MPLVTFQHGHPIILPKIVQANGTANLAVRFVSLLLENKTVSVGSVKGFKGTVCGLVMPPGAIIEFFFVPVSFIKIVLEHLEAAADEHEEEEEENFEAEVGGDVDKSVNDVDAERF